jgi:hypothetical protein
MKKVLQHWHLDSMEWPCLAEKYPTSAESNPASAESNPPREESNPTRRNGNPMQVVNSRMISPSSRTRVVSIRKKKPESRKSWCKCFETFFPSSVMLQTITIISNVSVANLFSLSLLVGYNKLPCWLLVKKTAMNLNGLESQKPCP